MNDIYKRQKQKNQPGQPVMEENDFVKVWNIIKLTWLTFTGKRLFTELLDDVQNISTDESDDLLKVYQYKDDPIRGACLIT